MIGKACWAMAILAAIAGGSAVRAAVPNVKGLWLTTDYASIAARAGETTTIKLKLQNYNLPPGRVALSIDGVPDGWKAAILGGGTPVSAAMPGSNDNVALSLRVDVPSAPYRPPLPSSAAALFTVLSSVFSPVAIRMTFTAAPITSAVRLTLFGPFGIRSFFVLCHQFVGRGKPEHYSPRLRVAHALGPIPGLYSTLPPVGGIVAFRHSSLHMLCAKN